MGERETNRGATKALRVYCHYLSRRGEEEKRRREDERTRKQHERFAVELR